MISFAKKFLSIALALVLLVGVLPMAAFAAGPYRLTFYKDLAATTTLDYYDPCTQITPEMLNDMSALLDTELAATNQKVDHWVYRGNHAMTADTSIPLTDNTNLVPVIVAKAKPKHTVTIEVTDIYGSSRTETIVVEDGDVISDADVRAKIGYNASRENITYLSGGTAPVGSAVTADGNILIQLSPLELTHTVTVVVNYSDSRAQATGTFQVTAWTNAPKSLSKSQVKSVVPMKSGDSIDEAGYSFAGIGGFGEDIVRDTVVTVKVKAAEPVTPPTPTKPVTPPATKHTVTVVTLETLSNGKTATRSTRTFPMGKGEILEQSTVLKYVDKYANEEIVGRSFNGIKGYGYGVNADCTVYVTVSPVKSTGKCYVTFRNVEGATISTVEVESGKRIDKSDIPDLKLAGKVKGKYAANWDYDFDKKIKTDLIVDPVFASHTYTLTIDTQCTELADLSYKIEYGDRFTDVMPGNKFPVLKRTNKALIGYSYDKEGNNPVGIKDTFQATTDMTIYAQWKDEAIIRIEYYANGNFNNRIDLQFITGVGVGEDYTISTDTLKRMYKNGYYDTVKLEGPYDQVGWDKLQLKRDRTTINTIHTVKGSANGTTLYCMVTDASVKPNSKPDNTNPKTGDDNMIFATTAVMLISAGALAVFFVDRKRRNG